MRGGDERAVDEGKDLAVERDGFLPDRMPVQRRAERGRREEREGGGGWDEAKRGRSQARK